MMTKTILRIVLSSPSDVENEHQIIEKIISELNKGIANSFNILLKLHAGRQMHTPDSTKKVPRD